MQERPARIEAPIVLPAEPDLPQALAEGLTHHQQGRLTNAQLIYTEFLQQHPGHPQTLGFLGTVSAQEGRFDEAIRLLTEAIKGNANLSDPQYCVANILMAHNQISQAIPHYTWAAALGHPHARERLQTLLPQVGSTERLASIRMLTNFYLYRNRPMLALQHAHEAIRLAQDDIQYWVLFSHCLSKVCFTASVPDNLLADIARAFTIEGLDYRLISGTAISAILHDDNLSLLFAARMPEKDPVEFLRENLRNGALQAVAEHPLLGRLLESAVINDVDLEFALTPLRAALLWSLVDTLEPPFSEPIYLPLIASLARQCFLNEYVWAESTEETDAVEKLTEYIASLLAEEEEVPAALLVILGAYKPLHCMPYAAELEARKWPEVVLPVVRVQISEPLEEKRLREEIPMVLPISGDVSELVQSQYEENPFPRWIEVPVFGKPMSLMEHMASLFPNLTEDECRQPDEPDILVAGCGTGLTPNYLARRIRAATITALDLSLSSLAYGKRKSRELGIENIEYIHGDIQNIGMLGYQFDHIDCHGVLHHMEDPQSGWQSLNSCLKPDGTMQIGLYSQIARAPITRAHELIRERGYNPTTEDMRKCRQDIIEQKNDELLQMITRNPDFFGMSQLRDLIFHYNEHFLTLRQVKMMIEVIGLQFLGFLFEESTVIPRYRTMFPHDIKMRSFDLWDQFESANPEVFTGCYSFWVRKPA